MLKLERTGETPALLDVFGGKLTTYRRLAEAALLKIESVLGERGKPWTATAKLAGGGFAPTDFLGEVGRLTEKYPALSKKLLRRLVRLYGTEARVVLGNAQSTAELGAIFGGDLSEREVDYLMENEWARTADDVLWRRTKMGLRLTPAEAGELSNYMKARLP